jgi:hypothetical protein
MAAMCLPLVVGFALVPARATLDQSLSLVMVLPVILIAVLAGARPGALAALSAAATFDLLFTVPYYRPTIDDVDDVVETVVLLIVGILVGLVTDSAQRAIASTRIRHRELTAITKFVDQMGVAEPDELIEHARLGITELLSAGECRWHPGYHGTTAPVLTASGGLVAGGPGGDRHTTSARLPSSIEIPVGLPPSEVGRFVVRTSATDVSIEERRSAAIVAIALGRALVSHPST